jgi:hypothetical protein
MKAAGTYPFRTIDLTVIHKAGFPVSGRNASINRFPLRATLHNQ